MFNHNLVTLPSIVQINSEQGRSYLTPDGNKYPSVTTVISAMSDKSFLEAWKKRVGEEKANEITKSASNRGTGAHKLCEKLVLNEDIDLSKEMPSNVKLYKQLEGFLVKNVDNIRASEGALYSHKLKVAGSVDLVADYKGAPAIVDFKTSAKFKKVEWIEGYFIQASMYAYMFWEMTGILCPTIVIVIAVEESYEPQIFVEKASKYLIKAKQMCDDYHRQQ